RSTTLYVRDPMGSALVDLARAPELASPSRPFGAPASRSRLGFGGGIGSPVLPAHRRLRPPPVAAGRATAAPGRSRRRPASVGSGVPGPARLRPGAGRPPGWLARDPAPARVDAGGGSRAGPLARRHAGAPSGALCRLVPVPSRGRARPRPHRGPRHAGGVGGGVLDDRRRRGDRL